MALENCGAESQAIDTSSSHRHKRCLNFWFVEDVALRFVLSHIQMNIDYAGNNN